MRTVRSLVVFGLSAAAVLAGAKAANAQSTGGLGSSSSGGGGLSSGGLGGGSLSSGGLGGSSGSSSLGGSSGFGGGTGTSSGSFGSTGTGSGSGSGSQTIGSTTVFGQYYGNPYSLGLPTATASTSTTTTNTNPTFGVALYNVQTNNTTTLTAGSTTGVATVNTTPAAIGASSIGVRRAPAYQTTLGFDYEGPATSKVQAELSDIFAHSSRLKSHDSIHVAVVGKTLVLQGTVTNDRERRLAESLARLTPGVRDLRNELTYPAAAAKATSEQ